MRVQFGRRAFVACGVVVGVLAGMASGTSIGAHFVSVGGGFRQDGAADSLAPTDVAGAPGYEQAHWNNLAADYGALAHGFVPGDSINDSNGVQLGGLGGDGYPVGVQTSWQGPGYFNNPNLFVATRTPDLNLMSGYMYSDGAPKQAPYSYFWDSSNAPDVYFGGLSAWLASQNASSYSVVVYTDGNDAIGRIGEYWLSSVTATDGSDGYFNYPVALGPDLTPHVFNKDDAEFADTGYVQIPITANSIADAASGNYIVFPDLTADSFLFLTVGASSPDPFLRSGIQAIQVVATPEPCSVLVLGILGAAGFAGGRRSRLVQGR